MTWLRPVWALWLLLTASAGLAEQAVVEPEAVASSPVSARSYHLDYDASFHPAQGEVRVSVRIGQPRDLVRSVKFEVDSQRYRNFAADGVLDIEGTEVDWQPPPNGGSLRFTLFLDHQRGSGGFDSRMEKEWAIFRGDDLLPPARVRSLKGAASTARLRMTGPEGWSFISAYPRSESDREWFVIDWPDRNFDRPVGWMAAGRLGVRWSTIAGRQVAVAGPTGQGVRHLDMLAFLRWNLPGLVEVFPAFPQRLLLVSAGDPMWRGGLSGPGSLYIHADRPLISGNGTSTLLHELVHVAQGYRAAKDEDWIVEAIAEYYTLLIMRRSGTISTARYERGLDKLSEWAAEASTLEGARSAGARTAKGVAVVHQLDEELRQRSGGEFSLDDVARQLAEDAEPVSIERLREIAASLVGSPLESISQENLTGDAAER
jgi:hypothetical protein